jgi:hypothetical protein
MRYDFVVTLKRESARKTDQVSLLLILLSIFFFSYTQVQSGISYSLCTAVATLILGLTINLYKRKQEKEMRFRYWLLISGFFWLFMPYMQWMILLYILFFYLEIHAKYPLEIGFEKKGIVINSLLKKKIQWSELQSVILKDGLLTIDFKNNKLIQKQVVDDDNPDTTEDEFNAYCDYNLVNLR